MERQPGMSRETSDRERSVLFVQVCMCVYVCGRVCTRAFPCVSVSTTLLPVSDFGTEMWFQLGRFKIRNTLALQTNWRYFCSQLCFVLFLLQKLYSPTFPLIIFCRRRFPTFLHYVIPLDRNVDRN